MWVSSTEMHRQGPHTRTDTLHRTHTHKQCLHTHSSLRRFENGESWRRGFFLRGLSGQSNSYDMWVSIVVLGSRSAEHDPVIYLPHFATVNAESTRHGAHARTKLAPQCKGAALRAPQPKVRETTIGRRRKACKYHPPKPRTNTCLSNREIRFGRGFWP